MPCCAAINCSRKCNKEDRDSGISFHKFPLKQPELLQKWLQNMRRDKYTPSKSAVLCSAHFEAHLFYKGERRRLLPDAVPTIFYFPKHLQKPMLYSYFRSSASWRVRIALAMKGVEYDYFPVHVVKDGGEQNKEEYMSKNPMAQVPTLVIDGVTLTQSIPIIEYLEETRSGPALLPKDAIKRAQARALAEVINSGIQPLQNLKVLATFGDKKMEWGKTVITNGFDAFEKMVATTAGTYCVGDEVTVADLCLIPQCHNASRFAVDMSKYPTIVRIKEALEELPAFIAADMKNQPDTPDELKA